MGLASLALGRRGEVGRHMRDQAALEFAESDDMNQSVPPGYRACGPGISEASRPQDLLGLFRGWRAGCSR